jgi:hypothetical protein
MKYANSPFIVPISGERVSRRRLTPRAVKA